jgi:polyribonucleotide 5'-hydroxyl-kinase
MDTDKKIMPQDVSMPDPIFDETLQAGFELRIDSIRSHIKVMVHPGGLAEVFGRELPVGEPVFFHEGENIAIFCWKPSHIQISGECGFYDSDKTPMHVYANISCALNKMRNEALQQKRVGPSLLVTGSQQSGKSTLCKMLVNYSIKQGWTPIFVDLDLQSGDLSPPGSISAAHVSTAEILPSDELYKKSISYFHGKTDIITYEFFNKQVSELAEAVNSKLKNDLVQFKNQF